MYPVYSSIAMTNRPTDADIETMDRHVVELTRPVRFFYLNALSFHLLEANPLFLLPQYGVHLTRCLLIGRYCSDVHIVNVAPLNDVYPPWVHEDLNFYAWSSGLPHYTDNFVDLFSNRKILNFEKLGESNRYHADYVVVYYDQVRSLPPIWPFESIPSISVVQSETALYLTYEKQNKALHGFVNKEKMVWHGDLFVAKLAPGTTDLLDVQESDVEDIKELVKGSVFVFRSLAMD